MRIYRYIFAFLVLSSPAHAFARGGPSGAFGTLLEVLLIFAIVGGLITGTICALCQRRVYWRVFSILSIVAAVISFTFPSYGIFTGIPTIVFLAVFTSASYLVRGSLFQEHIAVTPSNSEPHATKSAIFPSIVRWIATTYLFWAAFSLANMQLLSFLTIPPAIFFFPMTIIKFLPFILPPLMIALAIGTTSMAFITKRLRITPYAAPLIFNVCVLIAFFVSADIFRYHLMSNSLRGHQPNHFKSSSFLRSVLTYHTHFRSPHARFDENGKTYLWSYSERKFIQAP